MIYFIYLLILVSFIDTFSQLPIVSPLAMDLGASSILIGAIIGTYSFTNIIGNLISGHYLDKNGVKLVSAIGLFATGIILMAYTLIQTPGQMLLVRFFHGLAGGLLVPASFTYLSKLKQDKDKSRLMAFSGASVGLASIIGSAYGGKISTNFSVNYVFGSIGIVMLIMAILVLFLLPKPNVVKKQRTSPSTKKVIKALLKEPLLGYSYAGALLLMFANGTLAYMLPLKIEALGYDSSLTGMLLSTFALISTLIFALPTNRLYQKHSKPITMTIGIMILSICLLLLGFVTIKPFLFIVMVIYGVGFAFIFPTISSMVAEGSGENKRGMAYGLFYGFFSFGVVAGSFVTGVFPTVFMSFLIGSLTLMLGSILLWVSFKFNRKIVVLN